MSDDCLTLPEPDPPVFTVTVAGPERHDGEAGYTYVLPAADADTACALAMAYHAAEQELRYTEIRIDGPHGARWAWGFDPACAPDVEYVPEQSFTGAPPWPAEGPGPAWHDLRAPAGRARMAAVIDAEQQRLDTGRAFGIAPAPLDLGAVGVPSVPAPQAAWSVAQLRARRALAPARPTVEGEAAIPFIVGMSHINALVTAIDDRDFGNGVDAEAVGQVLLDANHHAVNIGTGEDCDAPEYAHRRRVVDHWTLLKAADCYRFQVHGAPGVATAAAYGTVGRLRTMLLGALDLDEDGGYQLRPEWDGAEGWPLLPAPREERAEALIECYQQFAGIEELDPPDWGQHIADMIADLLHWANTAENTDPWVVLDSGLTHFTEELHHEPPADAGTLRLLVATTAGQGLRGDDVCGTLDGEILFPPSECPHCHDPAAERTCHTLIGIDTGRATTTFVVDDVPITRRELHLALAKAWGAPADQIAEFGIPQAAEQMLAVAGRFPLGAVLGKTARRYRRRSSGSAAPAPPKPQADDSNGTPWWPEGTSTSGPRLGADTPAEDPTEQAESGFDSESAALAA